MERGRSRAAPAAVALAIAACVLMASAASVAAKPGPKKSKTGMTIPMKVTFNGSGTLTVEEEYEYPAEACYVNSQDTVNLNWAATFHALVANGKLSTAGGLGLLNSGPGHFNINSQIVQGAGWSAGVVPCESKTLPSCTGLVPSGAQPSIQISGGDVTKPISFEAQSATQSPIQSTCSSPVDVEVQNDLEVLESALPGAMTGRGELSAKALFNGSAGVPVSYSNAPEQVPSSCSNSGLSIYISNTGCDASMDWNGTVSFEADCGAQAQGPNCIKKKTKEYAAQAAKQYREEIKEDELIMHQGLGCWGPSRREVKWACAYQASMLLYHSVMEQKMKGIAKDPPMAGFDRIAKPHPPRAKGLGALRHAAPNAYALAKGGLKVAGLAGAVMTAQDRATAAFLAYFQSSTAPAALAKQDRAELGFAKTAAKLLKGRRKQAVSVAAELLRLASHLRGPAAGRQGAALRKMATGLLSGGGSKADKASSAAFAGIAGGGR